MKIHAISNLIPSAYFKGPCIMRASNALINRLRIYISRYRNDLICNHQLGAPFKRVSGIHTKIELYNMDIIRCPCKCRLDSEFGDHHRPCQLSGIFKIPSPFPARWCISAGAVLYLTTYKRSTLLRLMAMDKTLMSSLHMNNLRCMMSPRSSQI